MDIKENTKKIKHSFKKSKRLNPNNLNPNNLNPK